MEFGLIKFRLVRKNDYFSGWIVCCFDGILIFCITMRREVCFLLSWDDSFQLCVIGHTKFVV